jgi:hypothetical protein
MELLSVKEVPEQFPGLRPSTLYYWAQNGKIPHFRLNGRIFIEKGRLLEWLRQNMIEPQK